MRYAVLEAETSMLDFPIGELITPEEQVAVARAVAIMASRDNQVSDSERHFVEELMGQMMLLPEERDLVRKEFSSPSDLLQIAKSVTHREARLFLYYQAVCAAMADNKLVEGEMDALMNLAEAFQFERDVAKRFIKWVQDSLELRERGQQILVEM
jgi:uncharacterized membrane protein YebE (DUF533 family)